jgi:type I restriction enzyme S subunit
MNKGTDTLPQGWHLARFDEFLKRIERKIILDDSASYDCVGVRLYGNGAFLRETLTGLEITRKQQWVLKSSDVVYNKLFAWKGTFAIANDAVDDCIVSDKFPTYEADLSKVDIRFLGYYFRMPQLWKQAQDLSRGAAALSKLTLNPPEFWELTIPLPPLDEQRRIVAHIDALAARIEEARGLRQGAVEETDTILSVALRHYLEHSETTTHHKVKLGEVVESHDSGWSPQCADYPAPPGEWGVLKTTCVQWSGYDARQNKALLPEYAPKPDIEVRPGDVLITRAGPINRVGIACSIRSTPPHLMLSDKIVRLRLNSSILPEYLVIALATPTAQEYFRQGKTGLAASQVNISRENLLRMPVVIPPLEEQRRIVAYLDKLQAKTDALKQAQAEAAAELEALLPSVLDQAFRGEL